MPAIILLLCFVTLFCLGKGVIGFVAAGGSFATLLPVVWVVGGSIGLVMFLILTAPHG